MLLLSFALSEMSLNFKCLMDAEQQFYKAMKVLPAKREKGKKKSSPLNESQKSTIALKSEVAAFELFFCHLSDNSWQITSERLPNLRSKPIHLKRCLVHSF
ncbi:hypothetical protein CDAR_199751 [Caerostris darwini]|uniref:Uncharacterized protein n=1 Tax=Caerostris darwini TaxID=1538125 RepID=A0AAV4UIF2_9ARAC|nr:hypothetical protein CDAR_199751 [Caerostris darwini]